MCLTFARYLHMHSPSYPSRKVLLIPPFTEGERAAQRAECLTQALTAAEQQNSPQCSITPIRPSIHSLTRQMFATCLHVPDTVLGTWNSWVNKTDKIPTLMELAFECRSARACSSVTTETKKIKTQFLPSGCCCPVEEIHRWKI